MPIKLERTKEIMVANGSHTDCRDMIDSRYDRKLRIDAINDKHTVFIIVRNVTILFGIA